MADTLEIADHPRPIRCKIFRQLVLAQRAVGDPAINPSAKDSFSIWIKSSRVRLFSTTCSISGDRAPSATARTIARDPSSLYSAATPHHRLILSVAGPIMPGAAQVLLAVRIYCGSHNMADGSGARQ
jgi:hypothetical protein